MSISQMILDHSSRESLPIDVNDFLSYMRERGNDDEVEFIGVLLDPEILQGDIKVFHRRPIYGDPVRCVNIYYHREHGLDWQRFICCKELCHLLDPESSYSRTPAQVRALAERIGLPRDMQNPAIDGFHANIDRLAEYSAAALLLPLASREILLPKYKSQEISISTIATMADIPRKYAALVMSDGWPDTHAALVALDMR